VPPRQNSENTGTEYNVLIQPEVAAGGFTEFKIIAGPAPCFLFAETAGIKVTGNVIGIANTTTHAHLTLEPATNGANFKVGGAVATYESTQQTWMNGAPAEAVGLQTF
jgi:hypothetical protein